MEPVPAKLVAVTRDGRRREYLVRLRPRGVYSTIAGPVRGEDALRLLPAGRIEALRGWVYVLEPTWAEILEGLGERRTQVIYPKDSGYMVLRAGLRPGSTVLEAGIGSGFLSAAILSVICPTGRLIAYEAREEHLEAALRNLELAGLSGCLDARHGDVRKAQDLPLLDAAFLDMPDPWTVLSVLRESLRPAGLLLVFLPTASQVEKLLSRAGPEWLVESVEEILRREWEPNPGALRPSPRMIGHTGFIVTLRMAAAGRHRP